MLVMIRDRLSSLIWLILYLAVLLDSSAAPTSPPTQPADFTPPWANHTDIINVVGTPHANHPEIINEFAKLWPNYTNPNILRLNPFKLVYNVAAKAVQLVKAAKNIVARWYYGGNVSTTPPAIDMMSSIAPASCDDIPINCLRAYRTGHVCARTMYQTYRTFRNYCLIDYMNCVGRQDLWQLAYMGKCMDISMLEIDAGYPYTDDRFLDDYYQINV